VDSPSSRLVAATGLTRAYRRGSRVVEALRGIDLEVDRGELLVVIGPSGGGKSTLLNAIGGLEEPGGNRHGDDRRHPRDPLFSSRFRASVLSPTP
jgi:ABC-type lipoprotein export system ATPase subunit